MIKIFLLILLLFLLFYKKNIKEGYEHCIQRYYNQTATITDNNDINYHGLIRNSDNRYISVSSSDLNSEPILLEKHNIKNINFGNCNQGQTYEIEMNDENINIPCDIDSDLYIKNDLVNKNNWKSEEYKSYDNYCKIKDNLTCNSKLYDFECNESDNTIFKNIKEYINYCDENTNEQNDQLCSDNGTLWNNFIENNNNSKCGCIEKIPFIEATMEDKKNMLNEKIEHIMKRNCLIYQDNCKGFSYHIFNIDNKIDQMIYNNTPIDFNSTYYKNCHLNYEQKYQTDSDKTFIKKILNQDNSYICQ
tara:strand:+ start:1292 stop:2203 length:912 start_codon:yes stop_codon:yes gene_type:complete